MPSVITEFTGLSTAAKIERANRTHQAPHQGGSGATINTTNIASNNRFEVRHSFCASLRPQQIDIFRTIRDGKDIYVSLGAGGGKTLPIICYWFEVLLGLNVMGPRPFANIREPRQIMRAIQQLFTLTNIRKLPKIIFCVPRKALAIQIREQDFIPAIKSILIQMFDHLEKLTSVGNFFENTEGFVSVLIDIIDSCPHKFRELGMLRRFLAEYHKVLTYNADPNNSEYIANVENYEREFRRYMSDYIEFISRLLIGLRTGESHEQVGTNIVTVSIHQSLPNLLKDYEKAGIIGELRLVVLDEWHMAQFGSAEKLHDDEAYNISQAIYGSMEMLSNHNVRFVCLTGTVHPSTARMFVELVNSYFKRNFVLKVLPGKNPAKFNIIADNSLSQNIDKVIIGSVNSQNWGNLVILFSKNRIENLARECLNKLESVSIPTLPKTSGRERGRKYNPFLNDVEKMQARLGKRNYQTGGAINDKNELIKRVNNSLLRECLRKGFGFIHGDVDDNDKSIVQQLFIDKNIFVIIGTDALSVGMNLPVKSIYIPSVQKYDSDIGVSNMFLRDLNQLLNRGGRSASNIVSVFTPEENIDYILAALYASGQDYDQVPIIDIDPAIIQSIRGRNERKHLFHVLYMALLGQMNMISDVGRAMVNLMRKLIN
jgi:hypothetical protein